ncbi:unnamed protein product [Gordionus sp. m RMFG-2023]
MVDNILAEFQDSENAGKILKLKHFHKFGDTTEALDAVSALIEGKMGKVLRKFLKKIIPQSLHEEIAVADAKLGNLIKEKFQINCVHNSKIMDLMRGIRNQIDSLIPNIPAKELLDMSLGLAHSLSRYKLKFSPDKVDTMIIQTISLLDDMDKELNNYIMRCREWYGWHFPELGKIVSDHTMYAKVVKMLGMRTNAPNTDLSEIVSEDVEEQIKVAAQISMGTEISLDDILNIGFMCEQILEMYDYRSQLFDYLKNRVMAIAPNLSILVGELVASRLIAHAGSLMNLAKCPASTVQILGSEKAMFRALKTRHNTPKYGLLYHATLVGQATQKNKGKISRMLAAKAALATRYDALGENVSVNMELGLEHKAKLEVRLRQLEQQQNKGLTGSKKPNFVQQKFDITEPQFQPYDAGLDSTLPTTAHKRKLELESNSSFSSINATAKKAKSDQSDHEIDYAKAKKESKKSKKKVKDILDELQSSTTDVNGTDVPETDVKNKKDKKKKKFKDATE